MSNKQTLVLTILDGWGHREDGDDNAILAADTPTWDRLWRECPRALLSGSGGDVGLPEGQMGNSEVGHMTLGAGRVVFQQMTRIDRDIAEGGFAENSAYTGAVDAAIAGGGAVHILGLLSPGGVHSHERHIHAIVRLAAQRGAERIFVHAFLDGRDTPPRSARSSLESLQQVLDETGAQLASVVGRYYAMDRDQRWDRVEAAWELLTAGNAPFTARDGVSALEAAYERDENDEFVQPVAIVPDGAESAFIRDGDALIFMNFRADRARQISHAFLDDDFAGFERRQRPRLSRFVMTSSYSSDLSADCAYPPQALEMGFGELMETLEKTQLRIAETEKYAHVTFFFSGGREQPYRGEQRVLVPSPKVATYDLQPEMSAPELTEKLVAAIDGGEFDVIICNYANGDMVGHTGIFDAAVKAAEAIDESLTQLEAAVRRNQGQMLITADHGNCEQMRDHANGQAHTQHTTELVPLVYVGEKPLSLDSGGGLADVAPTMLALMDIDAPSQMSGRSLLRRDN